MELEWVYIVNIDITLVSFCWLVLRVHDFIWIASKFENNSSHQWPKLLLYLFTLWFKRLTLLNIDPFSYWGLNVDLRKSYNLSCFYYFSIVTRYAFLINWSKSKSSSEEDDSWFESLSFLLVV